MKAGKEVSGKSELKERKVKVSGNKRQQKRQNNYTIRLLYCSAVWTLVPRHVVGNTDKAPGEGAIPAVEPAKDNVKCVWQGVS